MTRRCADRVIYANVSADEHNDLAELAKREGISLAELIRKALNVYVERADPDGVVLLERRPRGRPPVLDECRR